MQEGSEILWANFKLTIFLVIFCAALVLLLFLSIIAYLIASDGKKITKKTSQKQHIVEKTKKFDTDLDKMIIAV